MNDTYDTHPKRDASSVISLGAAQTPNIDASVWIAPGAFVVGEVTLGADSSVWYNAVLRGDSDAIHIGERCNFQDGVVVHTQSGSPARIGNDVSVGHNAVVHGATIEDGCLVGMNATVLNDAHVGEGSLIAAGALVPQGVHIPRSSLVAGVPARVIRPLTPEEVADLHQNAQNYLGYSATHHAATTEGH